MKTKNTTVALLSAGLVGLLPALASADWSNDWMMDLRYNYALMSDTSGSDPNTDLSDHTTNFNGDGIEGENSFGIALGKSFDDMFLSLAYESMSGEYDISGSILANGTLVNAGTEAFDMENFMLELGVRNGLNESVDVVGLVGIGITQFDTDVNRLSGIVADGVALSAAQANGGNVGDSSDDISMRIGGGVEFKFAENVSLLTLLQYTNYGSYDSALQADDGTIRRTEADVEATELSMRLRFMF